MWNTCLDYPLGRKKMCDRMSQEKTTLKSDKDALSYYKDCVIPIELMEWLKNPVSDWNIYNLLLNVVMERMN